MPIRLIRKIASRINRKVGKSAGADAQSPEQSSKMPGSAAIGSGVVAKGASREVWRPGDPVPPVESSSEKRGKSASRSAPRTSSGGDRSRNRKPASARSDGGGAPDRGSAPVSAAGNEKSPRKRRSRGRSGREEGSVPAVSQAPAKDLPPIPEEKSWSQDDFVVAPLEGKVRFHDLDLPPTILRGVADQGFEYCTPIQARVLKEVAEGHNVAGKAQTGTGKTAAFLILIFKQFLQSPLKPDRPCGKPRALILAPTRELVIQIVRDAEAIGKHTGMNCIAVYGGADYDRQERELLRAPVDLIAATPGRLLDFRRKGTLDLSAVEVLVIDEADRMLDMGFIPDVKAIIRYTPPKDRRRTLLFSATLSDDVMRLASQWMPDPHVVEIEPEQVAVDTVKQLVYMVRAKEKFTVLYNLLKRPSMGRVLVFANRRDQTDRIAFELKRYGIACEVLSGSVDQKKRMRVLDDFRSGEIKTVVATDVAGRGLHVDNIDHVVNFDLPYEAEDYVHRIGRTGRAGAEGTAVSFACEDESFGIPDIEKYIGEPLACLYPEEVLLKPLPPPSGPAYVRPPRSGGGRPSTGGRSGSGRSGPPRGRGTRR